MASAKKTITREGIKALVKGRRYLTVSCKGITRIQLLSKRKDGSDFETVTVVEPDPYLDEIPPVR